VNYFYFDVKKKKGEIRKEHEVYELSSGLTDGKCMAMRLKGKPPHPDWPVRYPHEGPVRNSKCPIRAINDVENYLISIITVGPPPLLVSGIGVVSRPTYDAPYVERHVHVHEPNPEIEGDVHRVHPAAWVPPQVLMSDFGNRVVEIHHLRP